MFFEVMEDMVDYDLDLICKDPESRKPALSLKPENVDDFSLEKINTEMLKKAPLCHRVLKRMC